LRRRRSRESKKNERVPYPTRLQSSGTEKIERG